MHDGKVLARQRFSFLEMTGDRMPPVWNLSRAGRECSDGRGASPLIAIVGAGFSGTMAAVHLRRTLPPHITIGLFERTGRFARGPAYTDTGAPHLLNVRAKNMSALPDEPNHFDDWLATQSGDEVAHTNAGNFATRRLYGRYLRQLLYREMVESGGCLRLASADVTSIMPTAGGYRLGFANGAGIDAIGVVLAIGNLQTPKSNDGIVFHNPWSDTATAGLRPDEPVLIVGTGLTMIDIVLDLRAQGFNGTVIAVSRRGLVPHRHEPVPGLWPAPAFTRDELNSLPALLRRLRLGAEQAATEGVNWRAVIDGLRPVTVDIWRSLPRSERNRFLRHLRPYWDIHRHRIAPSVADGFDALRRAGTVSISRGRVAGIEAHDGVADVVLRAPDGSRRAVTVQRVIHALGPRGVHDAETPISDLSERGLVRIDPHGMGVEVTDSFELVGADGTPTPGLWALGPIMRGTFWECTAVPDIRVHAATLARAISRAVAQREQAITQG